MTLTVFIPTYNRADYLSQAIDSVLTQTYFDFKLVVVDNDSNDKTSILCKGISDPRFAYVKNPYNLGMQGNWQRCLDLCNTEWFALLEDDNLWEPDFLLRTFKPIDDVVLMHSDAVVFSDKEYCIRIRQSGWRIDGCPFIFLEPWESSFWQCFCSQIAASSAIFKTSIARQIGGFHSDYKSAQDWYLLSQIGRYGRIFSLQDSLVRYRLHDNRASVNSSVQLQTKLEGMRISSDNLKWSLSHPNLKKHTVRQILSKLPIAQLYGLLEAVACSSEHEDSLQFAKALWDETDNDTNQCPRSVKLLRHCGWNAMRFYWIQKNKMINRLGG